jgi:hypothetical protein
MHNRARIHLKECQIQVDGQKLDYERETDGQFYCVCDHGFPDFRTLRKHVSNCFLVISRIKEGKRACPLRRTLPDIVTETVEKTPVAKMNYIVVDDGEDDTVSESSKDDKGERCNGNDGSEEEEVVMEGNVTFFSGPVSFMNGQDEGSEYEDRDQMTSDSDVRTMASEESVDYGKLVF